MKVWREGEKIIVEMDRDSEDVEVTDEWVHIHLTIEEACAVFAAI